MGNKIAAIVGGIAKFVDFIRRRKDIKELQDKYGADKQKVIKILLTDSGRSIAFQVAEGSINYEFKNAHLMESDVNLYMNSDTLLNLLAGRIKVLDHSTNKRVYQPYSYADAVRWDDVQFDGEGVSNDNRLAMEVFGDSLQEMQDEWFPQFQQELEVV